MRSEAFIFSQQVLLHTVPKAVHHQTGFDMYNCFSLLLIILLLNVCIIFVLYSMEQPGQPGQLPTRAQLALSEPPAEHQLIDLLNFDYLLRQPACQAHTQALIMVQTATKHKAKRSLIRQTWGKPALSSNSSLRLIFLVGNVPPAEQQLQAELAQEHASYGDLLQGNFQDVYRNITYKHVMSLKWFHDSCATARLLVKVDDDIYLNTPKLQAILESGPATTAVTPLQQLLQQRRELLLCTKVVGDRVLRSYRSKWRVSGSEYAGRYYPPFCRGFAVIYTPDVVQRLYYAAQHSRYFRLDDVHITGVMSQRTNVSISSLEPYVLFEPQLERLNQTGLVDREFLVSWHKITPEQIRQLWQLH